MSPRITYQGACVLQALSSGRSYGFDIMDFTALPSGTVYPILRRLEEHGLVCSQWEDSTEARGDRRPRRRNYELTEAGRAALALADERLALHRQMFASIPDTGEVT